MTDKTDAPRRQRPFPWPCIECGTEEIYPLETDYTTSVKHDGRSYEIHIPGLMLPTCRKCGAHTITASVDDKIIAALRAQVGLLTAEEIRARRNGLDLTQDRLAEELGVAKESISRWETGAMIQSRAMDNFLRLYFASEEVRTLLANRFQSDSATRIERAKAAVERFDHAVTEIREELDSLKRELAV